MNRAAPPPIVCTLTTKEIVEQTLEWSDLRQLARSHEALPNGARSTFDLVHADAVEDLAGREADCCGSWLDTHTERGTVLTLELTTTNPEGVELIRNMAGLPNP